ncbi:energy-coupling factor transporter ATP-binding protein EcfA2 [Arthrobacter pigmenti]|uniref:Energy-coupling factor transporter ATP-binding protein EcfA2 n=1 Tax=Arthrobacter pigmenti TaxID=271432 RepID=A0A846RM68_9MICC|nr:dynamin family protein [Arthrobacter pigmenti]NJC22710.1 energy-coupling factor transporter ATP-binding protein EcfA2 [Arthrobacter pigmenti]
MTVSPPESDAAGLPVLLGRLREILDSVTFPLQFPGSAGARRETAAAVAQLDDYILPRVQSLDAPLLAVVGGSTGAGKSTLVNALVGHPVTRSGAIRPTTRQPILLHHPAEGHWFADDRVLPTLSRQRAVVVHPEADPVPASRVGTDHDAGSAAQLRLQPDAMVPLGLALLDAPDIDSIADENRRLASQLLAAADLWLFVTTANRYADAVPWELLREASQRDILLAVVLDRVPHGVEEEVREDLHTLLAAEQLGHAPIFVILEERLDPLGMLPAESIDPLRRWLQAIAADAEGRREIARRTLEGAVRALGRRVDGLAGALDDQEEAAVRLRQTARKAYDGALAAVLESMKDGTLLRGEVLARWQDFVGTGEFMRGLESRVGRIRDRIGGYLSGKPPRAVSVETAIESGLQTVIVEEAAKAADQTDRLWRAEAAGRALLSDGAESMSPDFTDKVAREIRAWQKDLLELVRSEGANKRFAARMLSFGVNGVAVALMIVVFTSTAGLTGGEVLIAGGSAVVGQKLLEAIFGEDAVRRLTRTARDQLHKRCEKLLTAERERFTDLLGIVSGEPLPADLRALAATLSERRTVAEDLAGDASLGYNHGNGGNREGER